MEPMTLLPALAVVTQRIGQGRELAAATADVVYAVHPTKTVAQAFYTDLKGAASLRMWADLLAMAANDLVERASSRPCSPSRATAGVRSSSASCATL